MPTCLLQKAQVRLDDVGHEITQLRLKRTDVESSLEASISALKHALQFIRAQDAQPAEERIRRHRPRAAQTVPGPALTAAAAPLAQRAKA